MKYRPALAAFLAALLVGTLPVRLAAQAVPPVLAEQLVNESARLVDAVQYELAGTNQGRNLEIRGNALRGAAESFSRELLLRHADNSRRQQAWNGVERAYLAVTQALNNPPGTAPTAASTAWRIDRLIDEIRRNGYGAGLPQPPIGPPPAGYDTTRVLQLVDSAAAANNLLIDRILREVGAIYPYDGVVRDCQSLSGGLLRFRSLVSQGVPLGQLQASWHPLRNLLRQTSGLLESARPPGGIRANLGALVRSFDTITQQLQLSGDYVNDANQPPILGRPPAQVLRLADQAVAEIEAFLVKLRPSLTAVSEGPQLLSDGRNLLGAVMDLRQRLATQDARLAIDQSWDQVRGRYERLEVRVRRITQGRTDGPLVTPVYRAGELLQMLGATLGYR